jgi:hypothetical protein
LKLVQWCVLSLLETFADSDDVRHGCEVGLTLEKKCWEQ